MDSPPGRQPAKVLFQEKYVPVQTFTDLHTLVAPPLCRPSRCFTHLLNRWALGCTVLHALVETPAGGGKRPVVLEQEG